MQSYEIMIDGVAQPGDFATEAEANAAALSFRQSQTGRAIGVRPKPLEPTTNDGLGTVEHVDPSKVLVQRDGIIFDQATTGALPTVDSAAAEAGQVAAPMPRPTNPPTVTTTRR